ncbi:hypothetical protein SPBR_00542 [Sporothrix brasiliensis 5110]|uniref:DUF7924 domain-containing protein n=1 Tax=Sporothrix brasiliensis 5110 TaxID=1398154 RepID=A0A0C2ILP8_9PEZI|nr:uncharacterized protein SPBR_00542 [Sporothrix brasiliensis 5110]KIH90011.1 hypothetical protein SPBR_00542 [Sporothrix brasiliensis 5110]
MSGTRSSENNDAELEAWANWVYPPEFYDRLSKIHLTEGALAELDRRNAVAKTNPVIASTRQCVTEEEDDVARFARHGGPDLMDVCNYGYTESRLVDTLDKTKQLHPDAATTTETKTTESTPYSANFEQHLADHGVHATYSSQKPANWAEIRSVVTQRRPSLSSSQFSEGAFNRFEDENDRAKNKADVMAHAIPTILDSNDRCEHRRAEGRNVLFDNLAPLTDATVTNPMPDVYYGARPDDLARPIRDELGPNIMPSAGHDLPLAPNFFVEVKGPNGSGAVANRQARYDGAVGSRALHHLQNYGEAEPTFDGMAYTYSSTYISGTGTLQLYAHHSTAPVTKGGQPEHHMSRINAWAINGNADSFRHGVTAFRNARDLAKQHRDGFVQAANGTVQREQKEPKQISQSAHVPTDVGQSQEQPQEDAGEKQTKRAGANKKPAPALGDTKNRQINPPKRRCPTPAVEVSVRLTRAAKRRRCAAEV